MDIISSLLTVDALTALLTLSLMEIVLGIDNIIFISILVGRLPEAQREKIRNLGIGLALLMRLGLLFSITWVMGLKEPLFSIRDFTFSGRDLILLFGGLFLIGKSTLEIHHKVELVEEFGDQANPDSTEVAKSSMKFKLDAAKSILLQIIILDIVFSLDSVITAVGMASQISIMVIAMVIAMIVMLFSAKSIGDFVESNPALKILALSFLLLIGVMLVAESMGTHVNKGYIYFAMAFSILVEVLNMRYRTKLQKKKV
jgi:predicted tellurium resistance membrane protein TerC